MKSDMWLRLLAVRTQGYANQIVRENKAAQEILGPRATVEQIWSTFEKWYAPDKNPGQDLLKGLMSSTEIRTSDMKSLWGFIGQCTLAAKAMSHDETVRTTLTAQHNQELIAKRLGEAALGEWKMYRRKRLN